jgi:hypothetical protein
LSSDVEFGQRLRRNLKNCGCLWSNRDKTYQDFDHLVKHYYFQNPLQPLLGENWFLVENVLMEIPFVFEVKLLELAYPFGLECFFFLFSTMVDNSLVLEKQPKPQYNLKTNLITPLLLHEPSL